MPRINRRKSIHTPPRRDRIAPSKRAPLPDDGPTDFLLQRKAEAIGTGTVCDVVTRDVSIVGGKDAQARAEFASSSSLAMLYSHGKIISKQYRAGNEYARLHRTLFGRATPKQSTLAKLMSLTPTERLEQANKAARELREDDDDAYIEWLSDQRVLYERGEYRLHHIARETITNRRLIRIVVRSVCIDDKLPTKPGQIWRLRLGLNELADVWGFE